MTEQELEAVTIVALPDPFGCEARVQQNPRETFDRCEKIWSHHGKSSLTHALYCMHCKDLVTACHEAALEANLVLEISRFDDPAEESNGFAIVG